MTGFVDTSAFFPILDADATERFFESHVLDHCGVMTFLVFKLEREIQTGRLREV